MFYKVQIGTMTRKGNLINSIEKVVEFEGNQTELTNIMEKNYQGFSVLVNTIEKFEKVKDTAKMVKISQVALSLSKYITDEEIEEYLKIKNAYEEYQSKIKDKVKSDIYKGRPEIKDIDLYFNKYANLLCDIYFTDSYKEFL